MIQIITDDQIQKFTLNCKNVNILSNKEEKTPVNKENNVINLSYINNNKSQKTSIAEILFNKEKNFIKRLLVEKKINNAKVKMSCGTKNKLSVVTFKNQGDQNGVEKKFVTNFSNFVSNKDEYKLEFRFNDKIDIILGGKYMNFDEFQKLFDSNKMKIECEFKFYSVIYKAENFINIANRLKLLKIVILELHGDDKLLSNYKSESYFYNKKTTNKKIAVNNIMKLLTK